MKKVLSACSLIGILSLGAISANAQPAQATLQHQPPMKHMMRERTFDPAERATHLQKALQLSDEQTAKIQKIFEDSGKQRESIQEKYKPQFDAFHADIKNLRAQTQTQLNGVLTPKQQQALDAQHKHGGDICPHGKKADGDKHEHH